MTDFHVLTGADQESHAARVRKIGTADIMDSLRKGWADFYAMPTHLAFIGLIYPIAGIVMAGLAFGNNVLPLVFPLASGFALVGPLAGIFLYEISRRRERGEVVHWRDMFDVLRSPAMPAIAALGVGLLVLFLAWIGAAQAIYYGIYGYRVPTSMGAFVQDILTTREGFKLMIVGNLVGLCFAAVALVISFISFPMIMDRDVGVVAAVRTSVRAAFANPGPVALWGIVVAGILLLGSVPLFVGLAIAVPVLGHATWHLYRHLVVS